MNTGVRQHQKLLVAIVALATCAWLVVVQQGSPEVDAQTVQQSLAALDDMLAVGR